MVLSSLLLIRRAAGDRKMARPLTTLGLGEDVASNVLCDLPAWAPADMTSLNVRRTFLGACSSAGAPRRWAL